jgi:hypothetical protein
MKQPHATNVATHPRRARALEMLLEGRTDSEIGNELGVDRATVWRWRHDPALAQELELAQRERQAVLTGRMAALVPRALDVLAEVMNDQDQPSLLRIRAADSLLDRAAWTGGAQGRRIREEVKAHVGSFLRLIAERLPAETLDAVIALANEPWPEPTKPEKRRPKIVVTTKETDDDDT